MSAGTSLPTVTGIVSTLVVLVVYARQQRKDSAATTQALVQARLNADGSLRRNPYLRRIARVMWLEIVLLSLAALALILPLKWDLYVLGSHAATVGLYYLVSLVIMAICYVATLMLIPGPERIKAAIFGAGAIAIWCSPWIAQIRLNTLDYSRLSYGDGVFALLVFSLTLPFMQYLVIGAVALRSPQSD